MSKLKVIVEKGRSPQMYYERTDSRSGRRLGIKAVDVPMKDGKIDKQALAVNVAIARGEKVADS